MKPTKPFSPANKSEYLPLCPTDQWMTWAPVFAPTAPSLPPRLLTPSPLWNPSPWDTVMQPFPRFSHGTLSLTSSLPSSFSPLTVSAVWNAVRCDSSLLEISQHFLCICYDNYDQPCSQFFLASDFLLSSTKSYLSERQWLEFFFLLILGSLWYGALHKANAK